MNNKDNKDKVDNIFATLIYLFMVLILLGGLARATLWVWGFLF